MASQDEAEQSESWFDNQIDSWADFGWDVSGIEDYLRDNSDLASEALLRVESVSYTHLTLPTILLV